MAYGAVGVIGRLSGQSLRGGELRGDEQTVFLVLILGLPAWRSPVLLSHYEGTCVRFRLPLQSLPHEALVQE